MTHEEHNGGSADNLITQELHRMEEAVFRQEELAQLKKLSAEHEVRQKQSALTMGLQIINTLGLVVVLSSAFYFGMWKGGVDQSLEEVGSFMEKGDRYPATRGIATEHRLEKLESDHRADINNLRVQMQQDRREILLELREIRKYLTAKSVNQ